MLFRSVVGSYAINATDVKNPVYQKAYDNTWNLIGSNAWASKTPTLVGNSQATALTLTNSLTINGTTFTIANTSVANLVATINTTGIPGVNAQLINGYFELFANAAASSYGNSTTNGSITISNGTGTPLTNLGLTAGTYASPTIQFSQHYSVPYWKATDTTPRPSGSIWLKTTAINGGANWKVYRWNSGTSNWDNIIAPVYQNRRTAIYTLDPTLGGLGIANGSLFVKYDVLAANTGT